MNFCQKIYSQWHFGFGYIVFGAIEMRWVFECVLSSQAIHIITVCSHTCSSRWCQQTELVNWINFTWPPLNVYGCIFLYRLGNMKLTTHSPRLWFASLPKRTHSHILYKVPKIDIIYDHFEPFEMDQISNNGKKLRHFSVNLWSNKIYLHFISFYFTVANWKVHFQSFYW